MSIAVICPAFSAPARVVDLGSRGASSGLWRKKILPIGSIIYKSRQINLTPEYLRNLAEAFDARAYDQVPFQLATAANDHTQDPERFRGQVVSLELAGDGLYALVRPTEAGERILRENPALGVSARIVEQYSRADGRYFPAAIQHLLGTLDPRVVGLGFWEPQIELANGVEQILDLSGAEFEDDGEDESELGGLFDEAEEMGGADPFEGTQFQGLHPTGAELAAFADVVGEIEDEDDALREWAAGSRVEDIVPLSNPLDAATIATARAIARAAVRLDEDFPLAARTYLELSQVPGALGQPRMVDLANGERTPCGPVDPETGGCISPYHQMGCSAIPPLVRGEYGSETVRTYNQEVSTWGQRELGGGWRLQDSGARPTLLDAIESQLGQRVRSRVSLYEAGKPRFDRQGKEVPGAFDSRKVSPPPAVVQRGLVWRDANSDDRSEEIPLPGSTAGDVGRRLAQMQVPGFERFGREQDHRADRRLAEMIGAAVERAVEADALGLSYSHDDLRGDTAALAARYRAQAGI